MTSLCNEICHESEFCVVLKQLKEIGCIQDNDGMMTDKGFRIDKYLQELKIKLNIPSSASQMSAGDVAAKRRQKDSTITFAAVKCSNNNNQTWTGANKVTIVFPCKYNSIKHVLLLFCW
jgi:predicted transcriptional regulator